VVKRLSPEKAAIALAELRAGDPVRQFLDNLATVTQREILACQDTYTLVTSANQGGKTTVAIVDCAATLRGIHPFQQWFGPVKVIVVVPSRAQAASIWGKRLLDGSEIRKTVKTPKGRTVDLATVPLIPASEVEKVDWAYSPQGKYPGKLRLRNGSEMIVILSGDANSWKRLQGIAADKVYRDEAVGNEDLGNELNPRLLVSQTMAQRGERPWGGRVLWVATATLINEEFEAYKRRCEENTAGHRLFWIDPQENPAVSMEVRASMRDTMSDEAAAIRMDGTASAVHDVLIFRNQWKRERHVLPEAYEPESMDNLWIGWDPGIRSAFGLVGCVQSPSNPLQIKVVMAWTEKRQTIDYQANIIRDWLDGRFLEGVVYDPAANKTEYNRGQSIYTLLEQLLAKMGVKIIRGFLAGRNRYEDTLPLMQRYLDPDPLNKTCSPLVVINPDSPEKPTGTGELINQLMRYRFKNAQIQNLKGAAIYRTDTDLVDPLRYIISRQPAWAKRDPNHSIHGNSFSASAYPLPEQQAVGPLDDDPTLDQSIRLHRQRLRESRDRFVAENYQAGTVMQQVVWDY
jgi:hypothetical protein